MFDHIDATHNVEGLKKAILLTSDLLAKEGYPPEIIGAAMVAHGSDLVASHSHTHFVVCLTSLKAKAAERGVIPQ